MLTFTDANGNHIENITNENLGDFKQFLHDLDQEMKRREQNNEKITDEERKKLYAYRFDDSVKTEDIVNGYENMNEFAKNILITCTPVRADEFIDLAETHPDFVRNKFAKMGVSRVAGAQKYEEVLNRLNERPISQNLAFIDALSATDKIIDPNVANHLGKFEDLQKENLTDKQRARINSLLTKAQYNTSSNPAYAMIESGCLDNYSADKTLRKMVEESILHTETFGGKRGDRMAKLKAEYISENIIKDMVQHNSTTSYLLRSPDNWGQHRDPSQLTEQEKKNKGIINRDYIKYRDALLTLAEKEEKHDRNHGGKEKNYSQRFADFYYRLSLNPINDSNLNSLPPMIKEAYIISVKKDITTSYEAGKKLEEIEKQQKELDEKIKKLTQQRDSGAIKRDEYTKIQQEINSLIRQDNVLSGPKKELEIRAGYVKDLSKNALQAVVYGEKSEHYAAMLPKELRIYPTEKAQLKAEGINQNNSTQVHRLDSINLSDKEKEEVLLRTQQENLPGMQQQADQAQQRVDTYNQRLEEYKEVTTSYFAKEKAKNVISEVQNSYKTLCDYGKEVGIIYERPEQRKIIEDILQKRIEGDKTARLEVPEFGSLPLLFGRKKEEENRKRVIDSVNFFNRTLDEQFRNMTPEASEELKQYAGKMTNGNSLHKAEVAIEEAKPTFNEVTESWYRAVNKGGEFYAYSDSWDKNTVAAFDDFKKTISDSLARIQERKARKQEASKILTGQAGQGEVKAVTDDMTVAQIRETRAANQEVKDPLAEKQAQMEGKDGKQRPEVYKKLYNDALTKVNS